MVTERSPRWGATTKLVVALVVLALVAVVARRFSELFAPLLIALIFAYVLNPPVTFVVARLKISRALAVVSVYLGLILVLGGASTALGFAIQRQVVRLDRNFSVVEALSDLPQQLDRVVHGRVVAGPFTVIFDVASASLPAGTPFVINLSSYDLTPLYQQAIEALRPVFSQAGRVVGGFASAAASTVGWALFVLVIGFYMLVDAPKLGQAIQDAAFPGYEADTRRLLQELNLVWNAFLRGQLLLAIVIFAIVTVVMTALGLHNALVVGLIAGSLEFMPLVGPIIAGVIATAVALFQAANPFGLSAVGYALVVLVSFVVIQQAENNVLVPRIIGRSLDLHPLAVLIVAVMGASLAGVLGLLLAAPTLATVRLLSRYAYRKFFDLDPWPEPLAASEKRAPLPWQGWPLKKGGRPKVAARPSPPDNLPRAEYSYRIYWTKLAREWDADRKRAVTQAVAVVIAQRDFEPNDYERRYGVGGLDDEAHSGQSLVALQRVLAAIETSQASSPTSNSNSSTESPPSPEQR